MPRAKKNEPKNTGAKRGRPSKKQLAEQLLEQEKQFDMAIIEEAPATEEIALEEAIPTEDAEQEQTQEEAPVIEEITSEEAPVTEETTSEETVATVETLDTPEYLEQEQPPEEILDTPKFLEQEQPPEEILDTPEFLEQEQIPEESVLEEQPPVSQHRVNETPVDDPTVQGQLTPPIKIEVAMRNVKPEGKVRATANLTIADCLLIRNVKLMESRAGELYASMPKYTSTQNPQIKYNHCMAITDDFKEQLNTAMTETYEQILSQQQSGENTAEQSMDVPDGGMTLNM